ncbi:hypothetical protein EMEDMD4_1010005 [Sinorhizobium medicae]|uniref:Uncharacterized protein n=1 Tax=Sinorhizobium medicae TaxID=110321 RepID=A0A508WT41_9HYPH|nr:hypothetical protein EMEDMD4_1010005 [Sinorhizobium medicae]
MFRIWNKITSAQPEDAGRKETPGGNDALTVSEVLNAPSALSHRLCSGLRLYEKASA